MNVYRLVLALTLEGSQGSIKTGSNKLCVEENLDSVTVGHWGAIS